MQKNGLKKSEHSTDKIMKKVMENRDEHKSDQEEGTCVPCEDKFTCY